MSYDFFDFFKKYSQQDLKKATNAVEKLINSQNTDISFPEELYEKLVKSDVNQVSEIEVYDDIDSMQLDAMEDIYGKISGFRVLDRLSDISYPRELVKDGEKALVFRTAVVKAKFEDVNDALWEIEDTRKKFEDVIERGFGKIVAIDYLNDREIVALTSKTGANEEEIKEKVKSCQWKQKILRTHNGVEMSSFFKGDGENSIILVPREDFEQYLIASFAPKSERISKPSSFSVLHKKLKPYQVIAKLYKENKDFALAFHDMESPDVSEHLLDLTFRENGLKLKHYYSVNYSPSQALIAKHEINDKVITIFPSIAVKTQEDLADDLRKDYYELESGFDYAFYSQDSHNKVFRSFRHGIYRSGKSDISDVLAESMLTGKKRFQFFAGGEIVEAQVEGRALRVNNDQIGGYLFKKMHQRRRK